MAISLVDPSTSSIVTHDGGLISVRCFDFLGGARGTLTTQADGQSATGTVVKDEQTVAVQTTFTSVSTRFGSVADTVTIPLSSLNRETDIDYRPWIGLRTEGDTPTNAQANNSWIAHAAADSSPQGAGPGVGFSINGSFAANVDWLPREPVAEYVLKEMPFTLQAASTTGNFAIRAWGVTGGTLAIFLDALYFVPVAGDETPGNTRWMQSAPSDAPALMFASNGALAHDEDNDDLWWPGKFSVFLIDSVWPPGNDGSGQLIDFQEDDSEPTVADLNGFGSWDGSDGLPADPKSWMWYPVGGTHVDVQTLITDDFADTATSPAPAVNNIDAFVRIVETGTSSQVSDFWDAPANTRRGFFVEAGSGVGTCYFGDSTGLPTGGPAGSPFGWSSFRAEISWGERSFLSGSSTDPRNYLRTLLPHLNNFDAVARFRLRDNQVRASANIGMLGAHNTTRGNANGAWLEFDGTGNADLYLIYSYENVVPPIYSIIDGPVTIDAAYTLDDWIWVRVRKDGYHWRARAWADGASEPGTWDVDGFQPLIRQPQSPATFIDYEWDDNWGSSVNNDGVVGDPRGGPVGPEKSGYAGVQATCDAEQARCRVEVADYELTWDPSSGSLNDMNVHMEKYDGGVDYGSVVVPYGAHRFIVGAKDNYHFNLDTNGYNIRLWKDAGCPDYMTAGIGTIYERAPFQACFPQIYRLVIF